MRVLATLGLLGALALAADPPVEVVVSHFLEDLAWIKAYDYPDVEFTVYSKSAQPPAFAWSLPNVGRESHTYLHHIVRNYDRLANWTVFTQAARPSWGYFGAGPGTASGHLTDLVTFEDYLRPFPGGRDAFFVLSAASQFPSGLQTNRRGFMLDGLVPEVLSKDACPPGGAGGWTAWWWDKSHPQLKERSASEPAMLEFYHRYVAGDAYSSDPLTLAFTQGARFALSRARIHRRPRAYYAALLEQLSKQTNPIQGYWVEAAWFDIFHPEALQAKSTVCALPSVPAEGGLPILEMQDRLVSDAKKRGHLLGGGRRLSTSYSYAYTSKRTGTYSASVAGDIYFQAQVVNAAGFAADSTVQSLFEAQIASTAGVASNLVDVTITKLNRRLASAANPRRLIASNFKAAYSIFVQVDANGNPTDTNYNIDSIRSSVANVDTWSFGTAVYNAIVASGSTYASLLTSLSVNSVSGTGITVGNTEANAAPATPSVHLACLLAALAVAASQRL